LQARRQNRALKLEPAHQEANPAARRYEAVDPGNRLVAVAQRLGVSWTSVRRLVERKTIPANQVVSCAPWQIPVEALESEAVRKAVKAIKNRVRVQPTQKTCEPP